MPIKVNAGGVWKDAAPKVKVSGSWKDASGYVKAGGLWYQASSNGINIIIDSATTLYDFNLKTYMQGAGIWPASGPVVINELRITARTVIHSQINSNPPAMYKRGVGAPANPHSYKGHKLVHTGTYSPEYNVTASYDIYSQDLSQHSFTTGAGWPANSKINTFIVDGFIYGMGGCGGGGRGLGGAGGYTSPTNGYLTAEYTTPDGHGWPAAYITVPVTTLQVSGGIYGGGAGGHITSGMCLRYVMDANNTFTYFTGEPPEDSRPITVTDWLPFIANKENVTVSKIPWLLTPGAQWTQGQWGYFHGGGGGRGGGKGGLGGNADILGNAAGSVLPVAGGDGSIAARGVSSDALVNCWPTDAKYLARKISTPTAYSGDWGQDASNKANIAVYEDNRTSAATTFKGNMTIPTPGAAYAINGFNYYFTKPFKTWGGASITGGALITTIIGAANLKGRVDATLPAYP